MTSEELSHLPTNPLKLVPESASNFYDPKAILSELDGLDTGRWRLVYRERKEQMQVLCPQITPDLLQTLTITKLSEQQHLPTSSMPHQKTPA